MSCNRFLLAAITLALGAATASAQPTYKLAVRPDLAPKAEIKLEDGKVTRTAVTHDPGFRLLFNIKKDNKTIATFEARSSTTVELPAKEPGRYTVVLEQFFPTFKTGNVQKGEFKAISNVIHYQIEDGKVIGDASEKR